MSKRAALLFFAVLLGLCLAEVGLRVAGDRVGLTSAWVAQRRAVLIDGPLSFGPHPSLGYTAHDMSDGGPRTYGSDSHRSSRDGASEVQRIACVGGSTTAGAYPRTLGQRLADSGASAEIHDWGVAGWTTAESLLNFALNGSARTPDMVVILHAINDADARARPGARSDYTHYRVPWRFRPLPRWRRFLVESSVLWTWFEFRLDGGYRPLSSYSTREVSEPGPDVLDAATSEGFRRNLRMLIGHVRACGATPVLATLPLREERFDDDSRQTRLRRQGAAEHNLLVRELARTEGVLLVDLASESADAPDALRPHFVDQVHLTASGDGLRATRIAEALIAAGLVEVRN